MARTSTLTQGTNSFQTTAEDINGVATDLFIDGVAGTVSANTGSGGSGSGAINAQSTPNMTVIVKGGTFYITATPSGQNSQRLRVKLDDNLSYGIAANSTGATVYDYIYVRVDPTLANNPDVNGSTVSSLVTSRSTSSTTDNGTPPTYGLLLGVITVGNAVTSITNANVSDKRKKVRPATSNIVVRGQATGVNMAANAWTEITVTFPNGQAMFDNNYTVAVHAGEFTDGFSGSANMYVGATAVVSTTQFKFRVYNNYTSSLPCYVNYIAMATT